MIYVIHHIKYLLLLFIFIKTLFCSNYYNLSFEASSTDNFKLSIEQSAKSEATFMFGILKTFCENQKTHLFQYLYSVFIIE